MKVRREWRKRSTSPGWNTQIILLEIFPFGKTILYYVKSPIQLVGQCRVVTAIFLQGPLPLWPRPRSFALLLHRCCAVIEYLTSRKSIWHDGIGVKRGLTWRRSIYWQTKPNIVPALCVPIIIILISLAPVACLKFQFIAHTAAGRSMQH